MILFLRWINVGWNKSQIKGTVEKGTSFSVSCSLSPEIWASRRRCAEETTQARLSPCGWIFKSWSVYEDTSGVPAGGLCSVGARSKTGGQAAQTHFPLPAGAEYDLVTLTAHYHSKGLWCAQWSANSVWGTDSAQQPDRESDTGTARGLLFFKIKYQ